MSEGTSSPGSNGQVDMSDLAFESVRLSKVGRGPRVMLKPQNGGGGCGVT